MTMRQRRDPGGGTVAPARPARRRDRGSAPAPATSATAAPGLGVAPGDYSQVVNKSTGTLAMFTWGEYNDPDIVGSLAEASSASR